MNHYFSQGFHAPQMTDSEAISIHRARSAPTYLGRVPDVIYATVTKCIVWPLDIVSAHVRGLAADRVICQRCTVCLLAISDLVLTAIWHLVCEFHVVVHGIIDEFDTVGIVHCKLRVVACLNALVDDTVDNTEGVKVEVNSFHGTIGDFLILLMEVIEERWAIVALRRVSLSQKKSLA